MSTVTNVILVIDPDESQAVINSALTDGLDDLGLRLLDLPGNVGGNREAECDIYMAAWKNFDGLAGPDDWFEHLATLAWIYPNRVVAICHSGDLDYTRTWRPALAPLSPDRNQD